MFFISFPLTKKNTYFFFRLIQFLQKFILMLRNLLWSHKVWLSSKVLKEVQRKKKGYFGNEMSNRYNRIKCNVWKNLSIIFLNHFTFLPFPQIIDNLEQLDFRKAFKSTLQNILRWIVTLNCYSIWTSEAIKQGLI